MSNWVGKTHCKFGHELKPENVKVCSNGRRRCAVCGRRGTGNTYQQRKADRLPIGLCVRCGENPVAGQTVNCDVCRQKNSDEGSRRHARYKRMVVDGYGGSCQCCGEKNIKFLTVDHIHGGGGAERRARPTTRMQTYLEIIRAGFPAHLRVLCYNCNCGRDKNGGICPHEEERERAIPVAV